MSAAPARAMVGFCDLNGVLRGKRVPPGKIADPEGLALRMAASALLVDIWGADLVGHPAFAARGDPDGTVVPTGRAAIETPGPSGPSALLPAWFTDGGGRPLPTDPRGVLSRAVEGLAGLGLRAVVGFELELYLIDPRSAALSPGPRPDHGRPMAIGNLLSIGEVEALGPLLDDLARDADAAGIALADMLCEGGAGQVEVTLAPVPCALRAADDVFWLRHLVRAAARRHGLEACLMAKPFADQPGSGLHVHASLIDDGGANVMAAAAPEEDRARHAVAGLLDHLGDATLVHAPHRGSCRRLRGGALAPSTVSWGVDNRTCTLRLIEAPRAARRIENRLAGADANPYLVLTTQLGAMGAGLRAAEAPPEPVRGDAGASAAPGLPLRWAEAVERLAASPAMAAILGREAAEAIVACKRQELAAFEDEVTPLEAATYRDLP